MHDFWENCTTRIIQEISSKIHSKQVGTKDEVSFIENAKYSTIYIVYVMQGIRRYIFVIICECKGGKLLKTRKKVKTPISRKSNKAHQWKLKKSNRW